LATKSFGEHAAKVAAEAILKLTKLTVANVDDIISGAQPATDRQ
jgi:hypothetical protein